MRRYEARALGKAECRDVADVQFTPACQKQAWVAAEFYREAHSICLDLSRECYMQLLNRRCIHFILHVKVHSLQ